MTRQRAPKLSSEPGAARRVVPEGDESARSVSSEAEGRGSMLSEGERSEPSGAQRAQHGRPAAERPPTRPRAASRSLLQHVLKHSGIIYPLISRKLTDSFWQSLLDILCHKPNALTSLG